jgi:hypothetical protein
MRTGTIYMLDLTPKGWPSTCYGFNAELHPAQHELDRLIPKSEDQVSSSKLEL